MITNIEEFKKLNEEANFPAQFAIDDAVSFVPMFKHQQLYGISNDQLDGIVTAVRFSKAKVFYDIVDEYYGKLFDEVDSCKVTPVKIFPKINEATNTKKIKEKIIDIPIYFGKLIIIYTKDFNDVNKKYNTVIDNNLYDAVVFEITEKDEYIVAIKVADWSIIAHEVTHLVNAIFKKCGVILDIDNDEPQAYLTGWIIDEIDIFLKFLKIKNEK